MNQYRKLINDNESIQHIIEPRPSRNWLILVTILLFGLPVIYYIYSIRKRPEYIVTNNRIIAVDGQEILNSWPYSDMGQIQIGQNWFEILQDKGHIIINLPNSKVKKITDVDNYKNIADTIGQNINEAN